MNNGMFSEMCAYISNRDRDNEEYRQYVPEGELEAIFTKVSPKSRIALGLAGLGHLVKAFFQTIFNTATKKAVEEGQTRL